MGHEIGFRAQRSDYPYTDAGGKKDGGEQARTNHSREKVEDAQLVSHITCKQVKVMHVMQNPEG